MRARRARDDDPPRHPMPDVHRSRSADHAARARWSRRVRRAVALLAGVAAPGGVALVAACGSDEVAGVGEVADIVIEPSAPVVAIDGTIRLTATPRDAGGQALAGRGVLWSSADRALAEVSGDGTVTPRAVGRVQIAASAVGRSTIVELQITPEAVAQVAVSPDELTLQAGETRTLGVVARSAAGATLDGRSATWSSGAPGVATVSGAGVVSAVAAGTATISATVDGVAGTSRVTVTAPPVVTPPPPPPPPPPTTPGPAVKLEMVSGNGQSAKAGTELEIPLVVRVVDAGGRPVPAVLVTWTASDGGSPRPLPTTLTDAQGLASVRWRLGNPERTQTMRAAVIGLPSVTFTAEATKR